MTVQTEQPAQAYHYEIRVYAKTQPDNERFVELSRTKEDARKSMRRVHAEHKGTDNYGGTRIVSVSDGLTLEIIDEVSDRSPEPRSTRSSLVVSDSGMADLRYEIRVLEQAGDKVQERSVYWARKEETAVNMMKRTHLFYEGTDNYISTRVVLVNGSTAVTVLDEITAGTPRFKEQAYQ